MSCNTVWSDLAARLVAALKPIAAPIGIAFVREGVASDAPPFEASYPAPNESGRTGAVPAGCVFWIVIGPIRLGRTTPVTPLKLSLLATIFTGLPVWYWMMDVRR